MKKLVLVLLILVMPAGVYAAGSKVHLDKAPIDLSDKESLQRGAKTFVEYCLSCHSASLMRYNRFGRDADVSDEELKENYIFTRDKKGEQTKVGELMKIAMSADYAKEAFGTKAPDLSAYARFRGADWLYTYFRTFYADPSRPFGVNNLVFPDVGMPHVFWQLQGEQQAVFRMETKGDQEVKVFEHLQKVSDGAMNADEYDALVADLVNYLVYMGEPIQQERKRIGIFVIIFLVIFTALAYVLKKEYWKDIH